MKIFDWLFKKKPKSNWELEFAVEMARCEEQVRLLKLEGRLTIDALENIYYGNRPNKWGYERQTSTDIK